MTCELVTIKTRERVQVVVNATRLAVTDRTRDLVLRTGRVCVPGAPTLNVIACKQGPSGSSVHELFEFEGDPQEQYPTFLPAIGRQTNIDGDPECYDFWWYSAPTA